MGLQRALALEWRQARYHLELGCGLERGHSSIISNQDLILHAGSPSSVDVCRRKPLGYGMHNQPYKTYICQTRRTVT